MVMAVNGHVFQAWPIIVLLHTTDRLLTPLPAPFRALIAAAARYAAQASSLFSLFHPPPPPPPAPVCSIASLFSSMRGRTADQRLGFSSRNAKNRDVVPRKKPNKRLYSLLVSFVSVALRGNLRRKNMKKLRTHAVCFLFFFFL